MGRIATHPSFRRARGSLLARTLPPRRSPSRWPALLAALTIVLAGCGSAASPSAGFPTSGPTSPPPVASGGAPISVVDDEGTSIALPRPPQRVVSLTPGTTEILFAIGAGSTVVATDEASDYPPDAVALPHVGDFGAVDIERIIGLGADLVVAGGNAYTPRDAIERLRSLGIPVVVIYAATVDGVLADIELVGRAVGRDAAAGLLAAQVRRDLDALAAATLSLPRPRVFYEVDASATIYGPADRSFLAEMVELAGGQPVTSGSRDAFEIPLERLIAADPEVIVLGDAAFGATPDVVRQRPGWAVMTAVRQGAIRAVDDKLVTRPGPRLALGLRSLILAVHPDARLP